MSKLTSKACLLLFFSIISFSIVFNEINAQSINLPKNEPIILPAPTASSENEPSDLPTPTIPQDQVLSVSINKAELSLGEKAIVETTLDNQTQQSLRGKIVLMFHPLDNSFPAKIYNYEFDLLSGETTETFISEMLLEDWMIDGVYEINAQAKDQYGKVFVNKTLLFEVIKKNIIEQDIEANADVCSSEDCSEKKMIFGKDEIVYLKLNTKINNLKISSTLKTPSGKIEELNFVENMSSYSLSDKEPGTYSIWINLSGDGYKNRRIEKEFIFEEGYTEEVFESVCKIDGKCAGKEDKQNCPQDCLPKTTKDNNFYIFVIAALLAAAAGIIIFILKKRKSGPEKLEK